MRRPERGCGCTNASEGLSEGFGACGSERQQYQKKGRERACAKTEQSPCLERGDEEAWMSVSWVSVGWGIIGVLGI